jgi:3-keto-5-aminohexanoate cleavage enzyme
MEKLIITAAVVGSRPTKDMNPAVPYKPAEIAQAAVDCWRAGAAVTHIHVRHPESGAPSMDIELFREVVERIRDDCDILINLSTSGLDLQGEDVIEQRLAPVELAPELCSLDIGSVNFRERVFINPPEWGVRAAERMRAAGVKPEIEVFDIGHIAQARAMIEDGLIEQPAFFQLCMGVGWGIEATQENLLFMRSKLPPGALWSVLGVGRAQSAMVTMGMLMDGHVRVGFEDNLWLQKGVPATSNAQFVEWVVRLARVVGRQVASPADARRILNLPQAAHE